MCKKWPQMREDLALAQQQQQANPAAQIQQLINEVRDLKEGLKSSKKSPPGVGHGQTQRVVCSNYVQGKR